MTENFEKVMEIVKDIESERLKNGDSNLERKSVDGDLEYESNKVKTVTVAL